MELNEAILIWLTRDGFVTPYLAGNPSLNDVLYTSEYFIMRVKRGEDPKVLAPQFKALMDKCFLSPGLLTRGPGMKDQEGPDDYIGIMTAYKALGLTTDANLVLSYGAKLTRCFWPFKLRWVYNNVKPGTFSGSAWLGRQPQLIAHFQYACGIKPPLWRRLWWYLVISNVGLLDRLNEDSWILSYLMIETARGQSRLVTWAEKRWQKRFKKFYPGGMKECLGKYFQNEDHPIAKYWVD